MKSLPGLPDRAAEASRNARFRILLVEDDDDTRQLLAVALETQRYEVDQAVTAAEGLAQLRRHRYDLVLTDYDLPGKTGSSMLKEAASEDLLHRAATVVVTAHPQPEGVGDSDIIQKPLELTHFLRQVGHILNSMADRSTDEAFEAPVAAAPHVELVLYVTADSPASQRARRHLDSVLGQFDPDQLRLEVCDVGDDPARGELDRVVFTPTLVTRCGGLATWVLGDLADRTMLFDLLHVYGVEPRK